MTDKHPLEILAENGPIKIISISDEQSAPIADVAAFAVALKRFRKEDYYGDAPYDLLVRSSQYAWNQFDQFAAVLIKAAISMGVKEQDIRDAVDMYRSIYIDAAGESSDILSAIRQAAEDQEHADQVSVLSIPCGSGKSTALTRMIHDVLVRNDGEGLIIVTDSIDRMDEYWRADSANPSFDDALLRFIARHKDKVAVMNSKNYDKMREKQYYAPVLVLTTQRYFSWTPERIKELQRWEGGTRSLIIFDEAPYLSEQRAVTVETINAVATALRMNIEADDEESRAAKYRAIEVWESIRTRLMVEMDELEYTPELQYAYAAAKDDIDLEAFLVYVQENRSKLDADRKNIVQMVEDTAQLLTSWGIYGHRSIAASGKYESKYTVHVDHRDLVTDIGAKVIVLDGTADVSPMYDEDYIFIAPTRPLKRSMAYLTIKLCDVPTSMEDLRNREAATAKMIRNYLADTTGNDDGVVIFTNEKVEKSFRALGFDKEHTGHFNNIKGLNTYSRAVNIAQVGLNRKPPVEYMTLDIARNDEVRETLAADTISDGYIAAMAKARTSLRFSTETMTRHVLADLDQNLYRGAIRNAANTKPFTYYVFFDHGSYQSLIAAIRERYEPLGATVELVTRETVEQYKPQDNALARIALLERWYERWDGKPTKRSKLIDVLHMTRAEFDAALRKKEAAKLAAKLRAAADYARQNGKRPRCFLG